MANENQTSYFGKTQTGVPPFLMAIRRIYINSAPEFQRVFGRKLFDFWDNITGFDVIKFDEQVIKPPEGISTKDAIEKQYGVNAVALVYKLWGSPSLVLKKPPDDGTVGCDGCGYLKVNRCRLWEVKVDDPYNSHCESWRNPREV